MNEKDSKKLWLDLEQKYVPGDIHKLGPYTTQAYMDDPSCLAFITSRYKFCSRILSGMENVVEIGCGDGFGGAIVAQKVKKLTCTDINLNLLNDNKKRMNHLKNVEYKYHDYRDSPLKNKVDAIYFIDVIEHIFKNEEELFLKNVFESINPNGVCLIGTPNIKSERYASKYSKEAHINLKSFDDLKHIGDKYFTNSFLFGMNDEVVHTGFPNMSHFLWLLCVNPRRFSSR
tara:strand:- start:29944 stop:30633 length:690 start_codon:yes stop_codon:yes gene_type:complete